MCPWFIGVINPLVLLGLIGLVWVRGGDWGGAWVRIEDIVKKFEISKGDFIYP